MDHYMWHGIDYNTNRIISFWGAVWDTWILFFYLFIPFFCDHGRNHNIIRAADYWLGNLRRKPTHLSPSSRMRSSSDLGRPHHRRPERLPPPAARALPRLPHQSSEREKLRGWGAAATPLGRQRRLPCAAPCWIVASRPRWAVRVVGTQIQWEGEGERNRGKRETGKEIIERVLRERGIQAENFGEEENFGIFFGFGLRKEREAGPLDFLH